MFACSLDAEKCFDRVWHDGLFYKLLSRIDFRHWLLLYEGYSNLKACVSRNGMESTSFKVTRGIRQGSLLSPVFFVFFIDDLLVELSNTDSGLRIGQELFNNLAYADDVNLIASSVPGLQILIDICNAYATKWRFTFGFTKTKCITFGSPKFTSEPTWTLGKKVIENVNTIEILGVSFAADLKPSAHIEKRLSAARKRSYSLLSAGFTYPGLATDVKVHLWKTVVHPVLQSGVNCMNLSSKNLADLESFQSNHVKRILGFHKRSHHSKLLQALGIRKIEASICASRLSLYNRIF